MRLQSVDARSSCVLLKQLMSYGFLMMLLLSLAAATRAQCPFSSGSTGADGAFAPTASQEVQVPESGVFNFTTVNIPAGVTITFRRNSKNTPVTILAQGNVTISGRFDVNGTPGGLGRFQFGRGGPGGFDGGGGGFPVLSTDPLFKGVAGDGPGGGGGAGINRSGGGGGGNADPGQNGGAGGGSGGPMYGGPSLSPLIGGSGGGGGSADAGIGNTGGAGGGGGGAMLIASSGTINFNNSSVLSSGSNGGIPNCTFSNQGGGGGGGSIRLIASSVTGSANLVAGGGVNACGGNNGGRGYVRVEACTNTLTISSTAGLLTFGKPSSVTLPNAPQLQIVSVAGVNAPANPSGSFNQLPDVTLQASTPNPVSIALQAANIPVGTVAQISIQPESGARTTVPSTPLAGTISSSTATASVTLPTGLSLITAITEFDVTTASAKPFFIDGEQIAKVEVRAVYGGGSEVTYVTRSGKRIKKND